MKDNITLAIAAGWCSNEYAETPVLFVVDLTRDDLALIKKTARYVADNEFASVTIPFDFSGLGNPPEDRMEQLNDAMVSEIDHAEIDQWDAEEERLDAECINVKADRVFLSCVGHYCNTASESAVITISDLEAFFGDTEETAEETMSQDQRQLAVRYLKGQGLTFGDCVTVFGVGKDSCPLAMRAEELYGRDGDLEFDDRVVLSGSDDPDRPGDYVMAWKWVELEEEGEREHA